MNKITRNLKFLLYIFLRVWRSYRAAVKLARILEDETSKRKNEEDSHESK